MTDAEATPETDRRPALVWRLASVLVATAAIWTLMTVVSGSLDDAPEAVRRTVNALVVCVPAVLVVILARRYLDRRPWAGLRLTGVAEGWRPFLVGIASFLLPAGAGLAVATAAGWVTITRQAPMGEVVGWFAALVLLVFLFEALPEELIFRGYVYRNLATAMAPWLAAVLQGVLFMLFGTGLWVATAGWGVLGERATIFLGMGIVMGLLRVVTDNLWTCIGFHLAFQVFAQNLLSDRFAVEPEAVFMLSSIVVAFVFATGLAELLTRREVNWTRPEPDLSDASAPEPAR